MPGLRQSLAAFSARGHPSGIAKEIKGKEVLCCPAMSHADFTRLAPKTYQVVKASPDNSRKVCLGFRFSYSPESEAIQNKEGRPLLP